MERERFQRLERVLEAIWQEKPEHRDRRLAELCDGDEALGQEARRLLALDREDDFLEDSPLGALTDSDLPTLDAGSAQTKAGPEAPGTRIGSYEIVRPLGEGGMGAVYLAKRHDGVHDEQVALKILAASWHDPGMRERFSAERKILAHLSHPNIASMLDGGTTSDGRPYLVMEWVDGVAVDRHCRQQDLSLRQRLELFLKICAAVQEAHRSLIVHRDLKPANILVDSRGEPKLLDFGIAKLLAPETVLHNLVVTATGNQPMTPAYASPEQVMGGAITTAVDVYALGIVLYELLTGERPYDLAGVPVAEAIRRICDVVPLRPSTRVRSRAEQGEPAGERSIADLRQLGKQLAGDLDAIVGMALRKEPDRRYPSAESLKDDIERYLDGRPVKAAGDSWSYQLGKFIGRHRAAVVAAAAFLVLVLSFTVVVLVKSKEVREERNRAEFTAGFLLDLFVGIDPFNVEARDLSAAEMLDRGRKALEVGDLTAPDRADLLHTIGTAYAGVGRYDEAEETLRAALEARTRIHGAEHALVAESMAQLADVLRRQLEVEAGLELAEEAQRIYRQLGEQESHPALLGATFLADYLDQLGRYGEAESTFRRVVASAERQGFSDLEAIALERLSMSKRRLLLLDEARDLAERSLVANHSTYGLEHPRTAQAMMELGTIELALGETRRARRLFEDAEAIQRAVLGEDHPETQLALTRGGELALALGEHERAEALFKKAEKRLREGLGEHLFLADLLRLKSLVLLETGRPEEAELAAQEAYQIFRGLVGERHVETADARQKLALAVAEQGGRLDEARGLIARSLATFEDLTGAASPRTFLALRHAGRFEVLAGELEEAENMLRRALDGLGRFYGRNHLDLAKVHNDLATVKHIEGAFDEAEAQYRKAIEIARGALGPEAALNGFYQSNLARLLLHAKRYEAATEALDRAAEIFDRAGLDRWHAWRLPADRVRANLWLHQGRHQDVDDLLRPWIERIDSAGGFSDADRFYTFNIAANNLEAWERKEQAAEMRRRLDQE